MSTIRVSNIKNESTSNGGISVDSSGHVTVDGQQMPTAGALSNRNRVINGGMLVNQRPNRAASGFSAAFYAGPDRWLVNRSGTGNTGFSQIANTDYGGTKAAQATFTAAVNETYIITQRIESSNIADLAGQTVTLSFYASGSSDSGSATLNASLSYANAVDNFATETVIATNSVSYTANAQQFSFTFTLPSDAANGVAVRFQGTKTSATGTFTFTYGSVQLEAGDKATPFQHTGYADELTRCHRYFQSLRIPSNSYGAQCSNSNAFYGAPIPFITLMRAIPSSITYTNEAGTDYWVEVATKAVAGAGTTGLTFTLQSNQSTAMAQARISGNTTPTRDSYYIWEPGFTLSIDAEL